MVLATDVFQRFTLLTVDKWYTYSYTGYIGTLHDLYIHTMGTELPALEYVALLSISMHYYSSTQHCMCVLYEC